ncbi:MAG: UvrD-helicase domain-containing protein [Planctomycetota bacterium]
MDRTLEGLNPQQHHAVSTTEGPVLVLAGAGTGKTRVITYRIAHLLGKGVAAKNILAMTFTNRAANEMKERVAGLVGKKRASDLTVGTFHSFCLRLLKAHAANLGLPRGFAICDAADQQSAVRSVLRELRVPEAAMNPRAVQARISLAKNRMISAEAMRKAGGDDFDELVALVYARYEAHLSRSRVLDFDDLLVKTVELLDENDDVRAAVRDRYRYVLVDEYQDTNGPQYRIVRLIADAHKNLCVVGDDDQSIYGWRGADIRKILGFPKDFPDAVTVRLETNYRSTEPILAAANAVIANNPSRHEKTLRSAVGGGEPIRYHLAEDEEAEANFVVREITRAVRSEGKRYGDHAVLFRTVTQPRAFEAAFRREGIPYRLVGGKSFFDRKEVRDLLAFLKIMANPDDEGSLLRIVNTPPRGIGKTTIDRVVAFATEKGISAAVAFRRSTEVEGLPAAAAKSVKNLMATLARLRENADGPGLVNAVRALIRDVDYRAEIERAYDDPQMRLLRWNAVEEVVNFAENYARRERKPTLAGFLEELALSADGDRDEERETKGNEVTLMTLHAAKGLEFPSVFLVGVEEGILPHARSVEEDTVEEERRLMYVGVTRARKLLTISLTKERAKYGRRIQTMASRFLYEMTGRTPPPDWHACGAESGNTEA